MTAPFVEYCRAGLSVIPISTDGTKSPAGIPSWRQYYEAPPTEETCKSWESKFHGIAILGGKASGNLEIIDIDKPELAKPYLAAVKSESPNLYAVLTLVKTPRRDSEGRGGCHVYYRCSVVAGNQKLAMSEPLPVFDEDGKPVLDSEGEQRLAPQTLIETRGQGGYVLSPGCAPECHPTRREYDHVAGPPITDIQAITPEQREILFRTARLFDRSVVEVHREPETKRFDNGERPGDVFASRAQWPDILEPHGWEQVGRTGDVTKWRRPGKTQGWSATTGIESKEGNSLLCVFSTNAHPFEGPASGRQCSSYSKFAAYAILNHHADYQAAAQSLAELGYGDKPKKPQEPARLMIKSLRQYVGDFIKTLESGDSGTIPTGIPGLDEAIGGGFALGEMVVIGAYSSHGKTALAFQMLMEASSRKQHGVIVSQEMPGISLGKRALQRLSDMPIGSWRDNIAKLRQHENAMKSDGYILVIETQPDMRGVERAIVAACKEFPITFAVVDYIQLVPSDKHGDSRYEAVSDVSRRLKQLATEQKVIIIAPAQCSDRQQAKANKPPTEHDLRDSGNIANDADVIITAHWPWKNDPKAFENSKGEYTIKVWKNRNREIVNHSITLNWLPGRQIFNAGIERDTYREQEKPKKQWNPKPRRNQEPQRFNEFDQYASSGEEF